MNLKDPKEKITGGISLTSLKKTNFIPINLGDYVTGKFWSHGANNFLVASFSETRKSDYGALRLYLLDSESKEERLVDSYYSQYPFNKVTHLDIDSDTTLVMIGYSGVVGPSHEALVIYKNKFSKPQTNQQIFDNRKMTLVKGKGIKNVLGIYEKEGSVFVQSGTFTSGGQAVDNFSLELLTEDEQSFTGYKAFNFVDTEDSIRFFYSKKMDQSKFVFTRVYDKASNKFLPTEYSYDLPSGYPRFSPHEIKCIADATAHKCAFLSVGSYSIWASFKKTDDAQYANPSDAYLLRLTSDQPALSISISSSEVVVTHYPGDDKKSDFSLFKLPEVPDLHQESVKILIASIKEELTDESKLLSITTDASGSHVLYIEERDSSTDSNIVKKMEIGEYTLVGSGKVSAEVLSNVGF